MNTKTTRGLIFFVLTMGALALSAGQALATTIHPAHAGEASLQEILNDITVSGPNCDSDPATSCQSSVNVDTDQVEPHAYWTGGGTGGSLSQVVIEFAGNATINTFGIYNPVDGQMFELFSGGDTGGALLTLYFLENNAGQLVMSLDGGLANGTVWTGGDSYFGFYLSSDDYSYYSDASMNGGVERMVGFEGKGVDEIDLPSTASGTWLSNEYIFAWEDGNDFDFNDFVVMVESVAPVPEPSALAMLGFGLLGLGVFLRRRSRK